MVNITHQQARSLLQAAIDQGIDPQAKTLLHEHIASCAECSAYAQFMEGLQADLRRLTHQQWDRYAPAFSAETIRKRVSRPNQPTNPFAQIWLAARFAAVTIVVITLAFAFKLTGPQPFLPAFGAASAPAPGAVLQTPTPAMTRTATQVNQPACQYGSHLVLQGETLADIAFMYGITAEKVLESNHLQGTFLQNGTVLVIPVCISTPTGTLTITPISELESPTPLG
jgi:hypothetical protein